MNNEITREDFFIAAALTGLLSNPKNMYQNDKMLILDAIEIAETALYYIDKEKEWNTKSKISET